MTILLIVAVVLVVLLFRIHDGKEVILAALDNLNANIAKLQTDVNTLLASKQGGATEAQVQSAADAVAAVDATVVAATPPAA